MPGLGVTLRLTLSEDLAGRGDPAVVLGRTVPGWLDALAGLERPTRVVLHPVGADDAVVAAARRLCEESGTPLAERPADDDVVVVADAVDLPGPHLLPRLVDAVEGGVAVADARTLPVGMAGDAAADGSAAPGTGRLVTGSCLAARADTLAVIGGASGPEVVARAGSAGLVVECRVDATVLRDVRVERDGTVVPRRATGPVSPPPGASPSGHPAALPASVLGALVHEVGLAVPEPDRTQRPFLSIVTRTQGGTRLQCLEEALTCLAAQTDRDFEVVLVCHRASPEALAGVHEAVLRQPTWLRDQLRVITVDRPGRAAPLNDGFATASGRYVVALDDDDTVLSHWVETFHRLEQEAPGRVLRAGALRQDVVPVEVGAEETLCPVPTGPATAPWPLEFSMLDHLRGNSSPFMSVAFPRGVVHGLGHRFEESLDTTEDWAFLVRAAAVVGVVDAAEHTCVYRWWVGEGSRSLHDDETWAAAHAAVRHGFDQQLLLLPPGTASTLVEALDARDEVRLELRDLAAAHQGVIDDLEAALAAHRTAVSAHDEAVAARDEAVAAQVEAVDAHDRAVAAHDEAVSTRDEAVAARGEAEAARDDGLARVTELEQQVGTLRERLDQRTRLHQERIDLLREAHAVLVATKGEVPGGRSLFDLNRKQLKELITRLASEPPATTRSLLGRVRRAR
ncbi:glycosyltransferase family A protein [uncultured Nocardioides sp.]|uniref:glycosyltransferase family A protein n=1 Tax=uncultured Nocardioides sp. TaxID=198441 RepID=UPI0025DF4DE4|nr:glycosyltransferase [uncultured Nocardioides sp.]